MLGVVIDRKVAVSTEHSITRREVLPSQASVDASTRRETGSSFVCPILVNVIETQHNHTGLTAAGADGSSISLHHRSFDPFLHRSTMRSSTFHTRTTTDTFTIQRLSTLDALTFSQKCLATDKTCSRISFHARRAARKLWCRIILLTMKTDSGHVYKVQSSVTVPTVSPAFNASSIICKDTVCRNV